MRGAPADDIWSLARFLSYGTLSVAIQPGSFPNIRRECANDALAEDGWSPFNANLILKHVKSSADYSLVEGLAFLTAQKFVEATYFAPTPETLVVRVYMIPYDLAGVQGRLRTRAEPLVTTARRLLADLLPRLSRSVASWDGQLTPEPPSSASGTTLSGLYEDLPSPPGTIDTASLPITERLLNYDDDLENLGLRSTLHRYQRRSVGAMVQREMSFRSEPDPLFLAVRGMNGQEFYFQPGMMEVLLERPMVEPCRGGILCEELGTGKTVMCLALILSTINQLSAPEPSILDSRPVLTPLSFRHFPSSESDAARARFSLDKRKVGAKDDGPRVPSLVELLLHKLAVEPVAFVPERRTEHFEALKEAVESLEQYASPRKHNLPFYLDYQGEPVDNERTNRRGGANLKPSGPIRLYLTSALLVVVPTNLLLQWTQEISLHCDDRIRVCVLKGNDPMPPARTLASDFDIILLTYNRFTVEDKTFPSDPKKRIWTGCPCPPHPTSRVPQCICKPPECSPLLQVRWKRLIIDEGHVSATLETVLNGFTKSLSVERRWIVSGTPTTNLLGLSLGRAQTMMGVPEDRDESNPMAAAAAIDRSRAPSPSSAPATVVVDTAAATAGPRIWTREDGEDLRKLGNMITHFVGMPQLLAKPSLMDTHVKEPLLNGKGNARKEPRPGAVDVLRQLMAATMIRHRIADVELEVKLPPVTHDLVFLDLHPLAVKSYNALQAAIAINAVSSERKDQDYMFHPQNVAFLAQTVENMSQLCFWHVDENMYNAVDNVADGGVKLRSKVPRNTNQADWNLLEEAIRRYEIAFNDPLWRAIQTHEDVPYLVSNLSVEIYEAWSRTAKPSLAANSQAYIHPDRARKLRELMIRQPLASEELVCQVGQQTAKEDAEWREHYQEVERRKSKGKGRTGGKERTAAASMLRKAKSTQAVKDASDASTVQAMQKELKEAIEAEMELELDLGLRTVERTATVVPSVLLAQSHIAKTRLGTTASSKLNFIIQEVLKYSPDEKFLIFSNSELTLAHIGEALALISVDFLRFSTSIDAEVRKQFVLTFETSEKYRVFLMELKHGARGLNLTSASRVIFCEPVWRPDIESQAIKRCHRIGQTRPITVKTLAIRATAEENMAARRKALKDAEKMPKLLEEAGFRAFIANPKFLPETPPDAIPHFEVPLVKLAPTASDLSALEEDVDMDPAPQPRRYRTPPSSPFAALQLSTPPAAARRRIRFRDEDEDDDDEDEGRVDASPPKRVKVHTPLPRPLPRVRLLLPEPPTARRSEESLSSSASGSTQERPRGVRFAS
ncbi:Helicase C-terminal domain-containing protein [Mycena chlorophos]|uniref:Helicase C-terminal domain-containing protein n=1 Tax=Mycena chlorophos TaxID=658473 RepID=A0A8H6SPF4_MYCCL|nr:Helicase C-terminal domain-containing protein [Mycena chlorophos]